MGDGCDTNCYLLTDYFSFKNYWRYLSLLLPVILYVFVLFACNFYLPCFIISPCELRAMFYLLAYCEHVRWDRISNYLDNFSWNDGGKSSSTFIDSQKPDHLYLLTSCSTYLAWNNSICFCAHFYFNVFSAFWNIFLWPFNIFITSCRFAFSSEKERDELDVTILRMYELILYHCKNKHQKSLLLLYFCYKENECFH